MSKHKRIRLLLIGEFEVRGEDPVASAVAQLDAFREAVQPAAEYGLTLYRATVEDVAAFAGTLWPPVQPEPAEATVPTAAPDPLASALASLDAFREAVQPASSARILFEDAGYHTTDLDEIEDALTQAKIRPEQAGFWLLLRAHRAPLTSAQTERYGVEFITTPERLRSLRRRYPCPTAVDVGRGVFGTHAGLLFVDDDDGRAVAYAPPELHRCGSA